MGVLSLVLSIIFGFVPLPGIVAFFGCIVSLILSIGATVARKQRGAAITGIVFSALGIIGAIYTMAIFGPMGFFQLDYFL